MIAPVAVADGDNILATRALAFVGRERSLAADLQVMHPMIALGLPGAMR